MHLKFLVLCVVSISCLFLIFHRYDREQYIQNENKFLLIENILSLKNKPTAGKSIFFLQIKPKLSEEVSLNKAEEANLTFLQACAVEAAALNNPNTDIYLLFAYSVFLSTAKRPKLIQSILSYPNVKLNTLDPREFTRGTPVEKWFEKGLISESNYPLENLSDLLRFLLLWRWGGSYFDTDVISLRSIANLSSNFVGAESEQFVGAGVLSFAPNGIGHKFTTDYLQDFKEDFNGIKYGYNGPQLITRILKRWCNVTSAIAMLENPKCLGVQVFPLDYFYPVSSHNWRQFIQPEYRKNTLDQIKNSYTIHLWNHKSKLILLQGRPVEALQVIMEKNCPKVYLTQE